MADILWLVAAVLALGVVAAILFRRQQGPRLHDAVPRVPTHPRGPLGANPEMPVFSRRPGSPPPGEPQPAEPARPAGNGGAAALEALVGRLVAEAARQTGADITRDPAARQRIEAKARQALVELTRQESAVIDLPYLVAGADGPRHFSMTLRRADLAALLREVDGPR